MLGNATRNRRRLRFAMAAAVAGLMAAVGWVALRHVPGKPCQRPNIVLITIDTLRADHLGCYGRVGAITPTIDEAATQGMRFQHAFAHVPLTLPSHASILTGQLPSQHGVRDNGAFRLSADSPVVSAILAGAGYRTAAFVSGFPLDSRFGLDRGFHIYDDHMLRGKPGRLPFVERPADHTTDAACQWLRQAQAPFFLWVHYFDPHAPYEPPAPPQNGESPYDGEIASVDREIARLLASVDRGRTVVIITADHGEGLGDHGEDTHGLFIYDTTIRVPLIIVGPGIRPAVVEEPAMLADIAPTILRLAGAHPPGDFRGRVLLDPLPAGRGIYSESLFGQINCGWAPLRSIRFENTKFIDAPTPELYDVDEDAQESVNLAPARPAEVSSMRQKLSALAPTSDPAAPLPIERQTAERLRSLGYASGAGRAPVPASGRDPKDMVSVANKLERAVAASTVDPATALRLLREIRSEDPQNNMAMRVLATALTHERSYEEASSILEELHARGDDSAETLSYRADVYRLAGHSEKAIETAKRAVDRYPDSVEARISQAKALAESGRVDEALAVAQAGISIAPDHRDALQVTADLQILLGDFRAAADLLRRVQELDPDDSAVGLKYGTCLARAGESTRASAVFRAIVEREPENGPALASLAATLAKTGDPASAAVYFERAVRTGLITTACYNGLAMARLESGDRHGARDALARSLALDPHQPGIRRMLESLPR
ncbi:MAG: sulfatase-like hydrolase/transferase [Acidobacteria bacterium]|nr:sulfatase-like hydrolase/transferase [Acidobacteriota bacterium]